MLESVSPNLNLGFSSLLYLLYEFGQVPQILGLLGYKMGFVILLIITSILYTLNDFHSAYLSIE